ncbi:hypothetical protein MU469_14170, partial [Staphylococcus aureus]|uniref:hypothetical protein n=1 Tax=Staphylococcus aureus TaxID=1280 RepID=UPI001FD22F8C
GAVVSVTFPFPDSDLLPDISVSVAVISLPTFNSVPSGTSTVPVSYTHLKKKRVRFPAARGDSNDQP